MLRKRVIPALLLSNGGLVKTTKFKNPKYIGDPINAIHIFNEKQVDELLLVDINASKLGIEPDFKIIEQIASECFMPLTYGGGIKTMEHANRLFECGVEKICLQSEVYTRPEFVTQLANRFGNQSIVVSTDIKKNIFGKSKLFFSKEGKISNSPWVQYLKKIEQLGAGEILLNAVDRDGTFSGPDLELISIAANEISIPIISLGGVSCLEDIKAALIAGASAVAAGSFFVYHGPHRAVLITYPQSKEIECL